MVKVAINGFGRIGRSALKIILERRDAQVVAINDTNDIVSLAHLLKHDSNYGLFDKKIGTSKSSIFINSREIKVYNELDPANLPWKKLGVDVVLECTGHFTDPKKASAHLTAGAKRVIISAPAKGDGAKTVVLGVNEEVVEKNDTIISNASSMLQPKIFAKVATLPPTSFQLPPEHPKLPRSPSQASKVNLPVFPFASRLQ